MEIRLPMSDNLPQTRDHEITPPDGVLASDYQLIEEAVMDTARGRWFLREYARRIRLVETSQVLRMLEQIEQSIGDNRGSERSLAETLPHLPDEGQRSLTVPCNGIGVEELKAVHEKLLDIVWYMRERGFDGQLCTAIRHEAGKLVKIVARNEAVSEDAGQGLRAEVAVTRAFEPAADPVSESARNRPEIAESVKVTSDSISAIDPDAEAAVAGSTVVRSEKSGAFKRAHSQKLRDSMVRLEKAAKQTLLDSPLETPAPAVSSLSHPALGDIDGFSMRDRLALFS